MQGILVLAILSVKGSYLQEMEVTLEGEDDVPDTLQWWIATEGAWRIRTFAIDHDIHVYSVGVGSEELLQLALDNNSKHYADIISCQHVLRFTDCENTKVVEQRFGKIGLPPRLEVAAGRFAFWKPDDGKYRTQSQPSSNELRGYS